MSSLAARGSASGSPPAGPPPPRRRLEPVVWKPPKADPRSRARRSDPALPPLRLVPVGGPGPEDVLLDDAGQLLTGLADGRIQRIDPAGTAASTVARTGGRPLGLEWLPDGRLLVCDAERGLLAVALSHNSGPDNGSDGDVSGDNGSESHVEVLVASGDRLSLANNAAVAADGTVYLSDSSRRFPMSQYMGDLYEHSGTGRLLRRNPSGTIDVLLEGLQFANGVALAADESFVVCAETGAYRLRRVWLTGPRAGQDDVLTDLPGTPDNLSTGDDGLFWVALPSPRDWRLDLLHRTPGIVRSALWSLPDRLQPAPIRTTWVMAVDRDGRIVHDLQDSTPGFCLATGVRARGDTLYLGSLRGEAIAITAVP